ncbi:hypothetical protein D3C71_1979390 [compost metagenome]
MRFHTTGKGCDLIGELRQRGVVAFAKLSNAASQSLGDTIKLTLYGNSQNSQPFIVHHQGFDLSFVKLSVLNVDLVVQVFLSFFELGL